MALPGVPNILLRLLSRNEDYSPVTAPEASQYGAVMAGEQSGPAGGAAGASTEDIITKMAAERLAKEGMMSRLPGTPPEGAVAAAVGAGKSGGGYSGPSLPKDMTGAELESYMKAIQQVAMNKAGSGFVPETRKYRDLVEELYKTKTDEVNPYGEGLSRAILEASMATLANRGDIGKGFGAFGSSYGTQMDAAKKEAKEARKEKIAQGLSVLEFDKADLASLNAKGLAEANKAGAIAGAAGAHLPIGLEDVQSRRKHRMDLDKVDRQGAIQSGLLDKRLAQAKELAQIKGLKGGKPTLLPPAANEQIEARVKAGLAPYAKKGMSEAELRGLENKLRIQERNRYLQNVLVGGGVSEASDGTVDYNLDELHL